MYTIGRKCVLARRISILYDRQTSPRTKFTPPRGQSMKRDFRLLAKTARRSTGWAAAQYNIILYYYNIPTHVGH